MKDDLKNGRLETIMIVNQLPSAHIIKTMLENAGIEVFLQNELMSQIYGGNTVGGILIQVAGTNAEKAKNLLMENGYNF
jgi:hypothetical protein